MNQTKNPTKTSQPYVPSRPGMVQPKREQAIFEAGMMPPRDIDSASAAPTKFRKPPAVVTSKVRVEPKKK